MADPLSIVASVLALASAAAKISKAISRLRRFSELPQRVHALKNEVSDLEAVLRQIGAALERRSLNPDNKHGSLEAIMWKIKDRLADLIRALDRVSDACKGGRSSILSKSAIWWKEKVLFQKLQEDIHSIKCTLNLMLSASHSLDLNQVMLELRRVTVLDSPPPYHLKSDDILPALNARIDEQHQDLSDRLDTLGAMITKSLTIETNHPGPVSALSEQGTQNQIWSVIASQRAPCRGWCPCSCHRKQKFKITTPEIMEKALGKIFIGYTGVPFFSNPCDFRGCRDRQRSTACMEYWFPWWFVSMNLKFHFTSILGGAPHFQLSTTKRVPDDSQSITYAMQGNIEGLRYLFTQGLAGPRDVSDSRGFSLVRWALYGGMHNYETVRFLLSNGALVDDMSYDNVWDFIFRNKCNEEERQGLRCITEHGEGDWMTEIIFKLSQKSLELELEENPNAVYVADAQNRTALDWATARVQLEDMVLLIRYGADPNNMDITGRTPVLHAVDSHNVSCLRLILEAGGHPDPKMPPGLFRSSPLTASGFAGMPEMLRLLLDFEADPRAANPEGLTALHSVARTHNVDCALMLLDFGADLNALSTNGRTPLTTAIMHNNHPVLQLFVDRCHEYITTFRLYSPRLLPIIAEYADIRTINILASSNTLTISYDLKVESIITSQNILKQRHDFSEKLYDAFDELIAIAKAEEAESLTAESLVESGLFYSARSSFHSDLAEAMSRLGSLPASPTSASPDLPGSLNTFEKLEKSLL